MVFFDRHKALIITALLFSITVLALVNIKLHNDTKELASTLIDLENLDLIQEEEPPQEQEIPEPIPTPERRQLATHQAYNQDEEASEDLDSRLQEIFEKNSSEAVEAESEQTATASGEFNISKNIEKEKKERSDGENTSEKSSEKSGTLKNSSIAFSLVGRRAIDIPNPIYTCDRSGKVVINIIVDAQGAVISTSVNKASSSTTNECLTNKALEYAAGAVFSSLAGRNSQPGTITYNFQG